ncbi:MAG: FtsX-like permease family protein [Erysipelotrichaceae bacterium]|nr:FtsX-like permease family protein [Erysipelotrichaceae bacterium]
MFNRDTFRLIRNTFNRFFSLFMIVLVSSSFMMGLFSNGTILRESVDHYNDKDRLQDLQLYSSYGFCSEDISALRRNEEVEYVFGSKMVDAYGRISQGDVYVFRFEEIDRTVNLIELVEGRMPENDREALILGDGVESASRLIGKKVSAFLNDEDIKEHLKNDSFTIVGTCKSPAYISKLMGSSNCENQELDGVLFIPNDNFIFDYYTSIYLKLKGTENYISYTGEYKNYVDTLTGSIESTKNHQQSYLRDKIYNENLKKLNDAKNEFEKQKGEGETKLQEAKQKLEDANIELIVNESLLNTNRISLETSLAEIEANERILDQNEASLKEGIRQAEEASGMDFDSLYTEVSVAYTSYILLKENNFDATDYNEKFTEELNREKKENLARIAEIDAQLAALDTTAEDYVEQAAALELERQSLEVRNAVIDQTLENYTDNAGEIAEQSKEEMMKAIDDQFNGSVEKAFIQLRTLYEARAQIQSARKQLEAGKEQAEAGKKALEDAKAKLEAGKREYERGLKEYNEALMDFNDEIEKAQSELNKASDELEELPNASWIILDRDSHYSSYMYKNTIKQMSAIGYAMPFLFYLVAALVCMTTMTRLIDEQRSQIGIFMALGFSSGQVIGKYVVYALLATLSGSILGILFGQLIFPTVIYATWRLMYDLPPIDLYYPWQYVLICIAAFALLMSVVTYLVARSTMKEMPSSLLRPKAPKSSKRVLLEKITFIWKRLPFTSKITARNIFRYKARFLMTIIGVAGCTGLLVVGFGIRDSISDVVAIQYGRIFAYDYHITLDSDHHLNENIEILKENLNNKEVVAFMTYISKAYLNEGEDDTLTVEVFDARESKSVLGLNSKDRKTPIELDNSGVILSEKFAINHHIKEGDYVTIESMSGLKRQAKVAKICEFYFQHYMFISESYYEDTFGENVHCNTIAVSSDNREELIKDTRRLEDFVSLTDFTGFIDQFNTMLKALNFIIAVIIVAAGSLALVVLLNLIQVNVAERIREIATLKVLGFHDMEVNNYIFKEILLLSMIGGLLGLPLGVLEHHFIMNVINMDMMMFGMNISIFSFSISFVITILFTLLVFMFMKRRLNNIEMVESLKSVE